MELRELLAEVDAPAALQHWAKTNGFDVLKAWDAVTLPEHRIWLAAVAGYPIRSLIDGVAYAAFVTADATPGVREALIKVFELAVSEASSEQLKEALARVDTLAEYGATYREPRSPGIPLLAKAASLVAQAAEALSAGDAYREAGRLERSRTMGALIGGGAHIGLPPREGPSRLDVMSAAMDPAHGNFLFCVAALAAAVAECQAALIAGGWAQQKASDTLDEALQDALREDGTA